MGSIVYAVRLRVLLTLLVLPALLAHPGASTIEDGSIYDDYLKIADIQPAEVDVYQGSNRTFSATVANHGNLCYDASITFRNLPQGVTMYPVEPETETIDVKETAEYVITIHASESAPVGTHIIEIADNSAKDPGTWQPLTLTIREPLPPPTPAPTKRITPVAAGIPTRPAEASGQEDGTGRGRGIKILIWIVAVLGALLGIFAFLRHKRV